MCAYELLRQTKLIKSTISNELQVLFHHTRIHAKHTARHRVSRIFNLKRRSLKNHLNNFLLKRLGPQVRILEFDLIDYIDAKI